MTLEAFTAAQEGSHEAAARLLTYDTAGGVRTAYAHSSSVTLDGSVTYDRERHVRRACSLRLVDKAGTMAPTAFEDEFANGARIEIQRGVVTAGETVWLSLGIFEVLDARSGIDGIMDLRAEDPSTSLVSNFGASVLVPTSTRGADALRLCWEQALPPGTSWDLDDAGLSVRTPRTFLEDEERMGATHQLMSDLSLEVYMTRAGVVTLRPYVDPVALPIVRTLRQSPGEAMATSLSRGTDWRPVNWQVVIGEPTDQPVVRGTASITDTSHPYHEARIGRRYAPVYRSSQVATQFQATALAQRLLADRCRWRDGIEWLGVPDFTLDAGDVVRIVEDRTRTDATYRIDRLTLPLTTGSMSFTASRVIPIFSE